VGEIDVEGVFDQSYKLIEGTNPQQFETPFCEIADNHVRPILDSIKASDKRIIGTGITDVNGFLPTHLTERSLPPGPDPVWNDAHCRNRRILMNESTRQAIRSEKPAMLSTYRMKFGEDFKPVKVIFVPLWIAGRRWGNYELAYVDVNRS
jgi:methyl-accepting chemotaxis protein